MRRTWDMAKNHPAACRAETPASSKGPHLFALQRGMRANLARGKPNLVKMGEMTLMMTRAVDSMAANISAPPAARRDNRCVL